jgi:hypothetical protein
VEQRVSSAVEGELIDSERRAPVVAVTWPALNNDDPVDSQMFA